jgi:hypothetical protein
MLHLSVLALLAWAAAEEVASQHPERVRPQYGFMDDLIAARVARLQLPAARSRATTPPKAVPPTPEWWDPPVRTDARAASEPYVGSWIQKPAAEIQQQAFKPMSTLPMGMVGAER